MGSEASESYFSRGNQRGAAVLGFTSLYHIIPPQASPEIPLGDTSLGHVPTFERGSEMYQLAGFNQDLGGQLTRNIQAFGGRRLK